jgi:DNA-directed RNA polymerase subunit N (RpoN/RPB10)
MLIPVRCSNCGKLLGDKYNYYVKRLRERKGTAALEPICFDGTKLVQTEEAKLFKELGIDRYCCKKVLLTHVDLIEKV